MDIHYLKNDNKTLFLDFKNAELLNIEVPQSYVPLYTKFFSLNDTNYKEQISKYLQHNYNTYPTYTHTEKDNDMFSCHLIFDKNIISTGYGKTKKKAEQNAAYKSLIYYNVLSE